MKLTANDLTNVMNYAKTDTTNARCRIKTTMTNLIKNFASNEAINQDHGCQPVSTFGHLIELNGMEWALLVQQKISG